MAYSDYINTPKLKAIVEAGAVGRVTGRGVAGGFVLVAKVGMFEKTLESKRGGARIFKSANGIVSYALGAGVRHVDFDLAGYDPTDRLFD